MQLRFLPMFAGALVVCAAAPAQAASFKFFRSAKSPANAGISYERQVVPLLQKYCYNCHGNGKKKGDFAIDVYKVQADAVNDPKAWEKVLENVRSHTMPPEEKPQPRPEEKELISKWIEAQVFACDCDHPDPGRVTLRRLNRAEYNNTIRDLVGVAFHPADDFPADDSGYGFDNIGDVLSVPPVLLEKYLAAAEKILDAAIVTVDPAKARVRRFPASDLDGSAPTDTLDGGGRKLTREGDIYVRFPVTQPGEYALRAMAYGDQFGPEPPRMKFSLNKQDLKTFDVPTESDKPEIFEVKVKLATGTNLFSAAYLNNLVDNSNKDPKKRGDRNLNIEYLEIAGPLDVPLPPLPTRIAESSSPKALRPTRPTMRVPSFPGLRRGHPTPLRSGGSRASREVRAAGDEAGRYFRARGAARAPGRADFSKLPLPRRAAAGAGQSEVGASDQRLRAGFADVVFPLEHDAGRRAVRARGEGKAAQERRRPGETDAQGPEGARACREFWRPMAAVAQPADCHPGREDLSRLRRRPARGHAG